MKGQKTFYQWNITRGHENVAVYEPGERCEAYPGCPIFPDHWVAICWYPGKAEEVVVAADEDNLRLQVDARTRLREYR